MGMEPLSLSLSLSVYIYITKHEEEHWTFRKNEEVYEMYKQPKNRWRNKEHKLKTIIKTLSHMSLLKG